MKLAFLSAIGCLLASTFVASAQDKKAPLPQEALVGEWANVTKEGGRVFTRFAVSKKGDAWSIEAWFNNGPVKKEVPLGKVTLSLLGDNLRAKSLPYGFATWNGQNQTFHMTLRLEKDEVVAEIFWIFKDKSIGSNIRSQEKYKKK
jgi:hypothetical protein